MAAILGALLMALLGGATSAGMAYLGHRFGLAHLHLLGGIPVGAFLIGAGAATGIAGMIRLTRSYDTAGFRIFAQLAGLAAFVVAIILDYQTLQLRVGPRTFPGPQLINMASYFQLLIEQGTKALISQLPQWVRIPPAITLWLGVGRLIVELVAAAVATGWMISLLADVPFCWRNRRFYELRQLVESANADGVREWELALSQRRPIEARAILARVRAGKVARHDRSWMRIAVHQCPVCLASRIRIERRRRFLGVVRTEPAQEIDLDPVRGSALLAT